ncbi:hypothetical protein GCG54_00010472 [Colletotrichum gloeosporioides]|uniref:Uncharacterized protein n=1 Tax=Colletotrichum gloeosporioides TaxID=474922 RepID=A0A8H4CJM5_COLGL|nr:uncharacterized protein GCG54_00010472 [Colletotrichum gloeosporioides]KAF3805195.1 hypothetical protein GCG54_00010472 [Colletotrichum gloeosporioides]
MAVQCYFLSPNEDAPNSRLPVLHYRNVLPEPRDEASVTDFLTRNRWEKRVRNILLMIVGTWGHIGIRHFHPNSHECYGQYKARCFVGPLF